MLLGLLAILVAALALSRVWSVQGQVRRLTRRLEEIEQARGRLTRRLEEVERARGTPAQPASSGAAPPEPPSAAPPITPVTPVAPASLSPIPATPRPPVRHLDVTSLEQLVGGVWLQNVGSVLLLLGVFLLIVWGYSTGRLGAPVLVGSGVGLGLVLVWRGHRFTHSVRAFGHALIGSGLGIVYLTLYLGHFRLGLLPSWLAFAMLLVVSIATVVAGLGYRVQTIAALGVVGAFLPQLMAAWLPLGGFALPPAGLLGHLAIVDALVFLFAARAGWSGLSLAALLLTTATWATTFHGPSWGWGIEIGLAALFTSLGLGPIPRLTRAEGRVRPIDLAVVAMAPLCFIASSVPVLAYEARIPVAMLLITLAAVQLAVALWVDARRPERDLWRPLTGAAVLYLTGALERAVGPDHTPLAWTAEGVVLVTLGLRDRGGWLRLCGTAVAALAALGVVSDLSSPAWRAGELPVLYPAGIQDLACISLLLAGAHLLARGRSHLGAGESLAPDVWTVAGNLLLLVWSGREASHAAATLYAPGGRWQRLLAIGVPPGPRLEELAVSLRGVVWALQALVLALRGAREPRATLRGCATGIGAVMLVNVTLWRVFSDGWALDQQPVLHAASVLVLAELGLAVVVSLQLARHRHRLLGSERWLPEGWALAASFGLLLWSSREASHVARWILTPVRSPGPAPVEPDRAALRTLEAGITSAAWVVEAVVLLVAGWARGTQFLRWCGLALLGLTLFKFLVVDLQTVDPFWRFLIAIATGVAMLAISYVYQARTRARPAKP